MWLFGLSWFLDEQIQEWCLLCRMWVFLLIKHTSIVKDMLEWVSYNVGLSSLRGHKSHEVVAYLIWDACKFFGGILPSLCKISKIETWVKSSSFWPRFGLFLNFYMLNFLWLGLFTRKNWCSSFIFLWNTYIIWHFVCEFWCFVLIWDFYNNIRTTRRRIWVIRYTREFVFLLIILLTSDFFIITLLGFLITIIKA